LVKEVDTDGNGTIELSEFLTLMGRRTYHDVTEEETRTSFRMYDKDDDGYITKSELRQVMAELGRLRLLLFLPALCLLISVRHVCVLVDGNSAYRP
jgi:hypothetical protein